MHSCRLEKAAKRARLNEAADAAAEQEAALGRHGNDQAPHELWLAAAAQTRAANKALERFGERQPSLKIIHQHKRAAQPSAKKVWSCRAG